MKGMQKISRGRSIRGVLAYALEVIDGEPRGRIIGGGMAGKDVDELSIEFNAARKLRPDIKKPVWHNSLRLPEGDKLDDATWVKIADRYMEKMGFDTVHQRVYIMHDDPKGQHIHIPAMRIGLDGTVYHGKNENLRSTRIIAELEKEFGLTITKGPDYDSDGKIVMPDRSALKKEEIEKAVRTGQEPIRQQLQKTIDSALKNKPSFTSFVERLECAGVTVRPTIAKGSVTGLSFELDGVAFSGSKLGNRFKFKNLLQSGMTYDKNRDGPTAGRLHAQAQADRGDGRTTTGHKNDEPGNSTNSEAVRGTSCPRDGADYGTSRSHIDQLASVDDRPGVDRENLTASDRKDRLENGEGNDSTGRSDRADPEAKTSSEAEATTKTVANPTGATVAPGLVGDYQSSSAGGGFDSGGEVADTEIGLTQNKASNELLLAAHKARKKQAQEEIDRAKTMWSQTPNKRSQNPFLRALTSLASKIYDIATSREREEARKREIAAAEAAEKARQKAIKEAELEAAFERNTAELERERERLQSRSTSNSKTSRPERRREFSSEIDELGR